VAVTSNQVATLQSMLQAKGERLSVVRSAVRCNELPIAEFAEQYGFMQAAQFLGAEKKDAIIAALAE